MKKHLTLTGEGETPAGQIGGLLLSRVANGQRATYLQLDYCTLRWISFPSLFALSLCSPWDEHEDVSLFQFLKNTLIFTPA